MVINIIQWNIRGFINNYTNLQILITEKKPDIICLQETNCKNDFTPAIPREYIGYFFNPNSSSKQGVAILIKKHISHSKIVTNSLLNIVGLQIKTNISFSIFSFYSPPADPIPISDLSYIITNINTPIIITGDFNAWSPLWGSQFANNKGTAIENFLTNSNLSVLNDGSPTHFSTRNTFTHIDLTISSISIVPRCRWQVLDDLYNSDHYPIMTQVLGNCQYHPTKISKFIIQRANWDIYRNKISNYNTKYSTSPNVNKEAASIRKIIKLSANESIPISSNKERPKTVPWWSLDVQMLRDKKQQSWRQFQRNMSTENLLIYKKNNAFFNRAKKLAKINSFKDFTTSLNPTTSSAILWQNIRKLTGNYIPRSISSISFNNNIITSAKEISETFASYWSQNSLDSKFSNCFQSEKSQTLASLSVTSCCSRSMVIESPFNMRELSYSLKTSKGKTPGLDKISYPMIAMVPNFFKYRILNLYNNIFDSGIIPQFFKTASVITIPKGNKPIDIIDSYRPISLLPCIAKLLEKMVSRRLMWFIKKHKLLSRNQTGFQAGLSTTDSLLYLDHIICKNRSTRRHTSILSIDFIKAFDRIGIHVVLQKLSKWSIGPKIFNFIKSFLTNRKFSVRVNDTFSNVFPLYNGIPQGSPLSVTLFIIAFDDLSRLISIDKRVDHCIYADDLYIIAKEQNNIKIAQVFQEILLKINSWSNKSGADISFEKTCHLHICKKRKCDVININFNNLTIQNVNHCKILGLNFDCKYSFKTHCNYLKQDLTSRLNIIKYLTSKKSQMHTNSLLRLVNSVMLSKIDYGLIIYNKTSKSTLKIVENTLNAAIRTSLRAFCTTPIVNLQAESGFEPLRVHINRLLFRHLDKISCPNTLLQNHIKLLKKRKTTLKYPSTLCNIFKIAKKNNINEYTPPLELYPPWLLENKIFLRNLQGFNKNCTSPIVFKSVFNEIYNEYKINGWQFLFTDGSKTSNHVGFALTDEAGYTQKIGLLPQNTSIFEAEAIAIIKALQLSESSDKKYVICTDSRSVFDAAFNQTNKNELIITIQQKIMKITNKIKLIWIPSHIGIKGNEAADLAAKSVYLQPTYLYIPKSKQFLTRCANTKLNTALKRKWNTYNHPYKTFNPTNQPLVLPTSTTCLQNKCFTRLRLTHTHLTHEHLIKKTAQPICSFCSSSPLTVFHILVDCPVLFDLRVSIFNSSNIVDFLKIPSYDNINKIFEFLKKTSLQNQI